MRPSTGGREFSARIIELGVFDPESDESDWTTIIDGHCVLSRLSLGDSMGVVSDPLAVPPGPKVQAAIVYAFWDNKCVVEKLGDCDNYFQYYQMQTRRLGMSVSRKKSNTYTVATKTHEDLLYVVGALRKAKHWRRVEVRNAWSDRFSSHTDVAINEAIDLALRLWLMLNVLDDHQNTRLEQNPTIQLNEQLTLEDFIKSQLP